MTKIARLVSLSLVSVVAACADGPASLEPDPALRFQAVAEATRCFTPEFTVLLTPVSAGTFLGEMSGDLEGTVLFEFDLPGSLRFAGATIHNSGTADWTITGGVVPDLQTFQTEFRNLNIAVDRPGSPNGTFENHGNHREIAGVEKANFSYTGTFVLSPTPEGLHHYRGTICP